jgi:hypothetical protein
MPPRHRVHAGKRSEAWLRVCLAAHLTAALGPRTGRRLCGAVICRFRRYLVTEQASAKGRFPLHPFAAAPASKGRARAVPKPSVTVYGYARVSTGGQSVDARLTPEFVDRSRRSGNRWAMDPERERGVRP